MIFIDTETTGLLNASANELDNQPKIIEICCIKTDDNFNHLETFTSFITPEQDISEKITQITGITDSMLVGAPKFAEIYEKLCNLFLGERKVIAHNCVFDMGMIYVELQRLERVFHFPWPPEWICTVEKSYHLENKRLKLRDLHTKATGKPHDDRAHRAEEDVKALIRCYHWLKEEGHA